MAIPPLTQQPVLTGCQILELPMKSNDAEAGTVREYLKELLKSLWNEGENFSGKYPFGNSGWEYDLYAALVAGGVVEGAFDEQGYYLENVDKQGANKAINCAIEAL